MSARTEEERDEWVRVFQLLIRMKRAAALSPNDIKLHNNNPYIFEELEQ